VYLRYSPRLRPREDVALMRWISFLETIQRSVLAYNGKFSILGDHYGKAQQGQENRYHPGMVCVRVSELPLAIARASCFNDEACGDMDESP